ncbi:MAG: hypothetical protein A2283_18785 [Lentisphaerae bacterium RIFOXYA12_FULL_48_11]|nr:MAG: hypothetical protein A2283_18785 [Lentisphaerae bacterium RIFOXYA12_FULL_48_11]
MLKKTFIVIAMSISLLSSNIMAANAEHRLGIAANYWKALDDVDISEIDENGVSWLASYQYIPGPALSFEADLEIFKKGFAGSTENVYAPQGYILLGSGLYAGIGMGIYYLDGEFVDRPFFAAKVGIELELIPHIFLDINANYRFDEWKNITELAKDVKTDTIMLGAALRLAF